MRALGSITMAMGNMGTVATMGTNRARRGHGRVFAHAYLPDTPVA